MAPDTAPEVRSGAVVNDRRNSEEVNQLKRKVQQRWQGVLRAGAGQAEVLGLSGHRRPPSMMRLPLEETRANTPDVSVHIRPVTSLGLRPAEFQQSVL